MSTKNGVHYLGQFGGPSGEGADRTVTKEAAVADYEGIIQNAFREVADALASTYTLRREGAARQALANSSQHALELAKARYERGLDGHLRYLDAQRTRFNDQVTRIQISTQR